MRRVDEAVREVSRDAITQELKDPRVGFVTVTAVETSPDLRHARVLRLRARRRRACAGARSTGLRSAHGFLQRRVADELRLKHTPTLDFVYDDTVDRGMRIDALLERARRDASEHGATAPRRRATQVLDELRGGDAALLLARTRTPTATRSARSSAMQRDPRARSARTPSCSWPPTSSRCPTSTASSQLDELVTEPPADLDERTIVFLDCGNIDRNPADVAQARRRAHPQHRPPPRQHALRHGQPRRARGVVHGRDRLGPDARPRRRR